MVSSVIYSWGKDTMTQAAITCRQSHFLAPVLETLWAEWPCWGKTSWRWSTDRNIREIFSAVYRCFQLLFWVVPKSFYTHSGSYSWMVFTVLDLCIQEGSTFPVITCFWPHLSEEECFIIGSLTLNSKPSNHYLQSSTQLSFKRN